MPKNKLVVNSSVIVATAWLVGLVGIYVLYDLWILFLDGVIIHQAAYQPSYGIWLSLCPMLIFGSGSITAIWMSYRGLKQIRSAAIPEQGKSLSMIVFIFGGIGILISTLLEASVLFVMFIAYMTGHL